MFISKDTAISSHIPQSNECPEVKVQKKFLFKTLRVKSSSGPDPVRQLNHLLSWCLNMEHHFRVKLRKDLFLFIHEHSFN